MISIKNIPISGLATEYFSVALQDEFSIRINLRSNSWRNANRQQLLFQEQLFQEIISESYEMES